MSALGVGEVIEPFGPLGALAGKNALHLFFDQGIPICLGFLDLGLETCKALFGLSQTFFPLLLHQVADFAELGAELCNEFFLLGGVGFGAGSFAKFANGLMVGLHGFHHFGIHRAIGASTPFVHLASVLLTPGIAVPSFSAIGLFRLA